jgi:acyl-CoA synthetase (AMP-forming)/AMP-acid ligase II
MQETCDTIYQMLKTRAERAPQGNAIVAPGRGPLTYALLLQQVEHFAHSLHEMGVGQNDRVAIVLPNGPEIAVAFLGVACCTTAAPLNPAYRENEFDFYLSNLNAKALIVQAGIESPARASAKQKSIPIIELSAATENGAGLYALTCDRVPALNQDGLAQAEDVALILYTSGTTAKPKMVPLTHRNLLVSAANIAATLQLTDADRCLNVMPLYHIHGLVGALLSCLTAGASVALPPLFEPDLFFDWLNDLRPTWYTAVPTIHQAIVRQAKDRLATLPRYLRFIRSSSAPLPPKLMAELEDLFKVPVIEAYGMTEAAHQIASNLIPPDHRRAGSVGIAAGSQIGVVDATGKPCHPGRAGRLSCADLT